jgi:hypothetical protein
MQAFLRFTSISRAPLCIIFAAIFQWQREIRLIQQALISIIYMINSNCFVFQSKILSVRIGTNVAEGAEPWRKSHLLQHQAVRPIPADQPNHAYSALSGKN